MRDNAAFLQGLAVTDSAQIPFCPNLAVDPRSPHHVGGGVPAGRRDRGIRFLGALRRRGVLRQRGLDQGARGQDIRDRKGQPLLGDHAQGVVEAFYK